MQRLFDAVEPIAVSSEIAQHAGEYHRKYGPSHGLLLPDALIAATAHIHNAPLITRNPKHFPMPEIDARPPR